MRKCYDDLKLTKRLQSMVQCTDTITYQGYCERHMPYSLRRQRDWENTPHEKRQKYLDLLHEGKSIGEARESAGISFEAALEITNRAVVNHSYLSLSRVAE